MTLHGVIVPIICVQVAVGDGFVKNTLQTSEQFVVQFLAMSFTVTMLPLTNPPIVPESNRLK